ncbi:MAG: glycine cleavage system protein GcvH [Rhodospirillales bacterium]|jgi:glycine cleavage system H protein|tara:strand:+ start:185 stop:562 length:378 start_codon:yes stop_codon:yes gene_type:complete
MSMKYSEEHEWVIVEGDIATVGITDYAQKALGDIVFVEAPDVGSEINQGDETGVVESVKAASDIITPVSGEVVEINEDLEAAPNTVNTDPTGDGWMFKVKLSDPEEIDGLMNAAEYKTHCESLDG